MGGVKEEVADQARDTEGEEMGREEGEGELVDSDTEERGYRTRGKCDGLEAGAVTFTVSIEGLPLGTDFEEGRGFEEEEEEEEEEEAEEEEEEHFGGDVEAA